MDSQPDDERKGRKMSTPTKEEVDEALKNIEECEEWDAFLLIVETMMECPVRQELYKRLADSEANEKRGPDGFTVEDT